MSGTWDCRNCGADQPEWREAWTEAAELRAALRREKDRADRAERALSEIRDACCGFDVSVGSVPETTAEAVRALAALLQRYMARHSALRRGIAFVSRGGQPCTPDTLARLLEGDHG